MTVYLVSTGHNDPLRRKEVIEASRVNFMRIPGNFWIRITELFIKPPLFIDPTIPIYRFSSDLSFELWQVIIVSLFMTQELRPLPTFRKLKLFLWVPREIVLVANIQIGLLIPEPQWFHSMPQ